VAPVGIDDLSSCDRPENETNASASTEAARHLPDDITGRVPSSRHRQDELVCDAEPARDGWVAGKVFVMGDNRTARRTPVNGPIRSRYRRRVPPHVAVDRLGFM
jgi:hypothetical protein